MCLDHRAGRTGENSNWSTSKISYGPEEAEVPFIPIFAPLSVPFTQHLHHILKILILLTTVMGRDIQTCLSASGIPMSLD